ncbi:MAG: hypothetical protein HY292_08585 [Planctomycetes bacterium]|nr:hypothetical protein [Planctomycetota bacterium]
MDVLGISAFFHDSAAALVRDGVPVLAAQEERFTRRKHDPSFPRRAIRACLNSGGISATDLDWVVFHEKPLRKFERILATQMRAFPRSAKAFSRSMFLWLGDRMWTKQRIASELGIDPSRVLFTEHHESHAASAFYPSPFDEAAILTVDGAGEWATTTLARGRGRDVEILAELNFPHSLGLLYSAITAFLGFEVNEGEHCVMSLAAYGEPRFEREIASLVRLRNDGSFELELTPFRFQFDPDRSFGPELERLLGPRRVPGSPVRWQPPDTRDADVAASVQRVIETTLQALVRELHRRVPSENLCLAGGVALNVVANARLLREGPFRRLFVQPAAGDAGCALGAALWVQHAALGRDRCFVQDHAFLGEAIEPEPAGDARRLRDDDAIVDEIVRRLVAGEMVGWVRGRFEWGPRGLGHRSLLADPRRLDTKDRIASTVKRREPFRPFAPSVPAERAAEFFDVPAGGEWPARFMLLAVPAKASAIAAAPAALHVDHSAQVQLVHADADPLFHRVLVQFGEATGAPILLNTSLNLRGDPIVRGEADALDLQRRSALDALVVEDRLYARG